ncbi:hypothetical protein DRO97_02615 [Archaeoglobales archaeon]|nr:MAG: hypothetical protein DRO97_02615 [Archaeoglobales archaeon]
MPFDSFIVVVNRVYFRRDDIDEPLKEFQEVIGKLEEIADGKLTPEEYVGDILKQKYRVIKLLGYDNREWKLFGFRIMVGYFSYDSTTWLDTDRDKIELYHALYKYELRLDPTEKNTKKAYEGLRKIHDWLFEVMK